MQSTRRKGVLYSHKHQESYSVRELDRQISASLFERTMIGNAKLPSKAKGMQANITNTFKGSYIFEFLNLSEPRSENDLQKALIKQMKNFIELVV